MEMGFLREQRTVLAMVCASAAFWFSAVSMTSGSGSGGGPFAFAALAAEPMNGAPSLTPPPESSERHHAPHFHDLWRGRFAVALGVGALVGALVWVAGATSPRWSPPPPTEKEAAVAEARYADDEPGGGLPAHVPAVWPGGYEAPRAVRNWLEYDQ